MELTPEQKTLVSDNYQLAVHLANAAYRRAPEVLDLEELTSHATLGLIRAAQKWEKEGPFSVFARRYILGHILDSQRNEDHVPKQVRRDYKVLQKLGFEGTFSGEKPIEFFEKESGLTQKRILHVADLISRAPVSLESTQDVNDDKSLANEIRSDDSVEDSVLMSQLANTTITALKTLSFEQQVIVSLRYHSGLDYPEIADYLNCSLAYVRFQHSEATVILHQAMLKKVS